MHCEGAKAAVEAVLPDVPYLRNVRGLSVGATATPQLMSARLPHPPMRRTGHRADVDKLRRLRDAISECLDESLSEQG